MEQQKERTPYAKRTFDNIPKAKQDHIVAIATAEFAEKGYDHSNINIIAEKAGVSVGSLYKYFDSKQDLFLMTVHKGVEILQQTIDGIVTEDRPFPDVCRSLIEAIQKTSRERSDLLKLYSEMTSVGNADLVKRLSDDIEGISARAYTALIEKAQETGEIRRDIEPSMAAFFMDNLFISLQFSYASEYYRQRFLTYAGPDIMDRDAFVVEQMTSFIKTALMVPKQ